MVPYPGFINGSGANPNPFVVNERTVNLFPSMSQSEGAANRWGLLPTPGVEVYSPQAASLSSGGRALELWDSRCFAVIGSEFLELQAGGARVVRGSVFADAEPCTVSFNGKGGGQLLVTSAGRAYLYDMTSHAWTTPILPGNAHGGAMLSGYFYVLDRATSSIYQSALLDGGTWNGTWTARRLIAGDPWRRLIVNGKDLWLLGERTSEAWYDSGTYPFALAPYANPVSPHGIAAIWSAYSNGEVLLWLSQTREGAGEVVMAVGQSTKVVSTFEVQAAIGKLTRIDDAIGWGYQDNKGHHFYVLSFPTGRVTWVLELSTMKWHERQTWIAETSEWQAWRPQYYASFNNRSLTLNRDGGEVFTLLHDGGLDVDSRPIRRIRRAPALVNQLRTMTFPMFTLHLYTGNGILAGQGSDPMVELLCSDDGGITFWSAGMASSGKIGQHTTRVDWTRLGSSTNRVFEIQMSDPVPWMIADAFLEAN